MKVRCPSTCFRPLAVGNDSEVSQSSFDSEVLGSTVQEHAAVVKRRSLVVVQQATFPDLPGVSILELGDWSIKERYGRA